MTRTILGLIGAVVVVILAAKTGYHINSDHGAAPINEAWAQNEMQFVAWNNEKWTAWVHDGEFELAPEDTRSWTRHSNISLAFRDWQGEAWQAKIEGDMFLLAYKGEWQGSIEQSEAIRFRDWSGNNQLRTVAALDR